MSRASAESIESTTSANQPERDDVDARLKPISRALSYPSAAVQQHFRDLLTRTEAIPARRSRG